MNLNQLLAYLYLPDVSAGEKVCAQKLPDLRYDTGTRESNSFVFSQNPESSYEFIGKELSIPSSIRIRLLLETGFSVMRFHMRLACIALLTLVMFCFAQTAQAFDLCCVEHQGKAHQEMDSKNIGQSKTSDNSTPKSTIDHCAICHGSVGQIPVESGIGERTEITQRMLWPDIPSLDSFIGEVLIQPPSLA